MITITSNGDGRYRLNVGGITYIRSYEEAIAMLQGMACCLNSGVKMPDIQSGYQQLVDTKMAP